MWIPGHTLHPDEHVSILSTGAAQVLVDCKKRDRYSSKNTKNIQNRYQTVKS